MSQKHSKIQLTCLSQHLHSSTTYLHLVPSFCLPRSLRPFAGLFRAFYNESSNHTMNRSNIAELIPC